MSKQILNPKSEICKRSHYRFLIKADNVRNSFFESKDHNLINQIKNVFRLNISSEITIFDEMGNEYLVQISILQKDLVQGKILNKKKSIKNKFEVGLFCSLLKGDHFETVLEKCTELGVSFFQPVIFDRSIIRVLNPSKIERYKKIIKEATEQSGRLQLPEIFEPISFAEAIKKTEGDFNLVSIIGASKNILDIKFRYKNVNIFIGPEGDFSQSELDFMKKEDYLFSNLGDNVLRSETACIIASGIILQNMIK
jgi:16S rRNA (uracil1498-N3)-methyltransferase